jgi:hypothetical protein
MECVVCGTNYIRNDIGDLQQLLPVGSNQGQTQGVMPAGDVLGVSAAEGKREKGKSQDTRFALPMGMERLRPTNRGRLNDIQHESELPHSSKVGSHSTLVKPPYNLLNRV